MSGYVIAVNAAEVACITASVEACVGIQHLFPKAGMRYTDAIALP